MAAYRSKWNKNGNIKLGRTIWSYNTLYSDKEFYIPELDMVVKGTCGNHCKACEKDCYVKKSYRHNSVKYGHALNTIAMRENPAQMGIDLSLQIQRARKKPDACRLDQSGEIESFDELMGFVHAAKENPEIPFFIYTKAYEIIIPAILCNLIPDNLTVLISIWHEYGIAEYNLVKDRKNVKAFVFDDNDFDYAAAGLEITTYCKAYDDKGRLDHEITCGNCKKCFNRAKSAKIIGCKKH